MIAATTVPGRSVLKCITTTMYMPLRDVFFRMPRSLHLKRMLEEAPGGQPFVCFRSAHWWSAKRGKNPNLFTIS